MGILVALILPRFGDVQRNANTKVCVANLRGLASAMATYETMHNDPNITWTGMDPANLVTWELISQEPFCPYVAEAETSYVLASGGAGSPDHATCPVVATYTDHVWP